MKALNVGVIGLGAIGQKHCDSLAKIRQANLVSLADVNEDVLNKTAEKLGAKPLQQTIQADVGRP